MAQAALTVNFTPIADANHQNANQLVFDAGNDSVIADAVLPEVAKFGALQRLANAARVFKCGDSFVKEAG